MKDFRIIPFLILVFFSVFYNPEDYPHDWTIYPNPTTDKIYSSGGLEAPIRIFDLAGRIRHQDHLTPSGVDVSGLEPGLYMIEVRRGALLERRKFVKR